MQSPESPHREQAAYAHFFLDIAQGRGHTEHQGLYAAWVTRSLSRYPVDFPWAVALYATQYNPVLPLARYAQSDAVLQGVLRSMQPWGHGSHFLQALEHAARTADADGDWYLWVIGEQDGILQDPALEQRIEGLTRQLAEKRICVQIEWAADLAETPTGQLLRDAAMAFKNTRTFLGSAVLGESAACR